MESDAALLILGLIVGMPLGYLVAWRLRTYVSEQRRRAVLEAAPKDRAEALAREILASQEG